MSSALTSAGPAAQPQEVLDVARRARQRAARPPPGRPSPGPRPASATSSTASARSAGSRTTPPLPTRSLPTSNCGFTISTRSPSSRGHADQRLAAPGQRDERQVADHQVDRAADQLGGQLADVGPVVHRAPARRTAAARPAGRSPTSTATTSRAPARSSTSVNPPVEAPASRQRRPATISPAARTPPARRRACARRGRRSRAGPGPRPPRSRRRWSTAVAGLVAVAPRHGDPAGGDQLGRCSRERASPRRTSSASSRSRRGHCSSRLGSGVAGVVRLVRPRPRVVERTPQLHLGLSNTPTCSSTGRSSSSSTARITSSTLAAPVCTRSGAPGSGSSSPPGSSGSGTRGSLGVLRHGATLPRRRHALGAHRLPRLVQVSPRRHRDHPPPVVGLPGARHLSAPSATRAVQPPRVTPSVAHLGRPQ